MELIKRGRLRGKAEHSVFGQPQQVFFHGWRRPKTDADNFLRSVNKFQVETGAPRGIACRYGSGLPGISPVGGCVVSDVSYACAESILRSDATNGYVKGHTRKDLFRASTAP